MLNVEDRRLCSLDPGAECSPIVRNNEEHATRIQQRQCVVVIFTGAQDVGNIFPSPYTRRTMAAGEKSPQSSSLKLNWEIFAGIGMVSAVYFADIFLKASRKCFWFDELFTTYLCRLPDFKSTWTAVTHGADFNPPMLYLLTRSAHWLFGEGLIATRLPAMVGMWVFGVCLFLFVARRAGVVSGFVAGVFPFFTLAQYYSYEARAHGIVLGWCGLALVCWQRNAEGRSKHLWLAGFGLALLGALLTHVYAVYLLFPFVLVEFYNLLHRRLNWGIIAAVLSVLVVVTMTVYLPLFRMYRATVPTTFRPGSHDLFQRFVVNAIGPALPVLLLWLAIFAFEGLCRKQRGPAFAAIPMREILLAIGFACIPLVGLLGSKVSHGPFIERYFLSSIAGYAIFLGFATSRVQAGPWTARALAGCMLVLMIGDLGTTVYLTLKHRIVLIEPSSGLVLSTTPSDPMALYDTLSMNDSGLDVLVLRNVEYLYFFRYAPPSVVSHLYYGAPPDDLFLMAYQRFAKAADINLKTTTFGPFLATHNRFLVYESGGASIDALQALANAGYSLKSARPDAAGIMCEYEKLGADAK